MRLMPFNNYSYQLAIDTGYEYILIQKKIERTHFLVTKEHDLQILKAVRNCENLPEHCTCEPVDSNEIRNLLCDGATDYFIILTDV